MNDLCGLFGKTRQAWYKLVQTQERNDMQVAAVIHKVKRLRKELPRCGGKKLHVLIQPFLERHGIRMGRDKLFKALDKYNLLIKRKKSHRTTNSMHRYRKYKNKIKDLELERPNQLWVSDITYVPIGGTFLYLCLITDAFSRKIVGWSLREDLSAKGPLEALDMAISKRKGLKPLIHHSDRGIQYCCNDYVKKLKKNKIVISMTENSDPYENALAERMNRTLKEEFLQYYFYSNLEEAEKVVSRSVRLYNQLRPHLSLKYDTPAKVHAEIHPQHHIPLQTTPVLA